MPPPPALSPAGVPLADFGTRLLAWLIDTAVVTVVTLIVALPLLFWFMYRLTSRMDAAGANLDGGQFFTSFFLPVLLAELGYVLFVLLCYYVYDVEMMYRSGQTLGKRIMKIRIVPLNPARPLTRGMAAKRYLLEFVGGTLIPFFHYLDGLWQLWDKPFQQTLHDKVAGTVVVKVSA